MTTWMGETLVDAIRNGHLDEEDTQMVRELFAEKGEVDLSGFHAFIKTADVGTLQRLNMTINSEVWGRASNETKRHNDGFAAWLNQWGLKPDEHISTYFIGKANPYSSSQAYSPGDVVVTSNSKTIPAKYRNKHAHVTQMRYSGRTNASHTPLHFPDGTNSRIPNTELTLVERAKPFDQY